MNLPYSVDPLQAIDLLAEEIAGTKGKCAEISQLVRALDLLMLSLHSIRSEDVPDIEGTELEPPNAEYRRVYEKIRHRYTTLGYYWTALHPIMIDGTEGELAVGDAIDDLTDILIDLHEVQWFNEHADRKDALAAMKFRYESHLWMHIHPLRQYLEEMKHDG